MWKLPEDGVLIPKHVGII